MRFSFSLRHSIFFTSTFLTSFLIWNVAFANAQSVVIEGDNGIFVGGCNSLTKVPKTCPGQTGSPLSDINDVNHSFPVAPTNGVMIGTNLTDDHTGPAASGRATLSGGANVQSAYLYIGHEKNTDGAVSIDGAGTKWVSHSAASVGHYGTGSLEVTNGGSYTQVNTDGFHVGYGASGVGRLLISGVDTATNTRSTVRTLNNVQFGPYGQATVEILDGGLFITEYSSSLGEMAGSKGLMTVRGVHTDSGFASTLQITHNQFWVGDAGTGTMHVLDGGRVEIQDGLQVSGVAGGVGTFFLDGVHSPTDTRSTAIAQILQAGYRGEGTIYITNGALANIGALNVGTHETAQGNLYVRGIDSQTGHRATASASTRISVGNLGTGHMYISDKGLVQSGDMFYVGSLANSHGSVVVDGLGSELIIAKNGYIGAEGSGVLTLINNGLMKAGQISIGNQANASGTLNIGAGGQAGILDTPNIVGGAGTAVVNFNHTDDLQFSSNLRNNLSVNHVQRGTTTLSGANNNYTGATTVTLGTLKAADINRFSAVSDHIIGAQGVLDLNGYDQSLQHVENAGFIEFGAISNTILTINGDYKGMGGIIHFNSVLGDDASATNKIITNSTSGHSFIKVSNLGGLGAQTQQGIMLIHASGPSLGTFALLGDYVHEGQQAVVGGAFAYKLYEGDNSDDWFLRSQLMPKRLDDPLYQAGISAYESYPQTLLELSRLNTLQQRIGNRVWADAGQYTASDTRGIWSGFGVPGEDENGFWFRVEGGYKHNEPGTSRSLTTYKQASYKALAGIDYSFMQDDDGALVGGVYLQYAHGKTNADSVHGDGQIKTDGYGAGATLTWYGHDGFYVDGQAQFMAYRSDLRSKLTQKYLKKDNNGYGYGVSAETGQRVHFTPEWSTTPQAQISYSDVGFRRFHDIYDARVSLDRGRSLQGRAGLSVDFENPYSNPDGQQNKQHIYGIANIYYEFLPGTRVDVATHPFTSRNERLWGGVGLGGTYSWNNEQFAVYGEGSVDTSLSHFADSHALRGTFGFRMRW